MKLAVLLISVLLLATGVEARTPSKECLTSCGKDKECLKVCHKEWLKEKVCYKRCLKKCLINGNKPACKKRCSKKCFKDKKGKGKK